MKGECQEALIEPNGEISPFIKFELYYWAKKKISQKGDPKTHGTF